MLREPRVLVDGLRFPEGPRWRQEPDGLAQRAEGERSGSGGRLWLSDMHDGVVLAVDLDGRVERIVAVPNEPSGLGWLPDGRLLVVSMRDRRLLRLDPEGLVEHADLSSVATFHCNDMVVDARGRAYVGNFGFDLHARAPAAPAALALVHPDGRVEVAAKDLLFPNGTVITPDGRTLIVGESFAARLTAFDVADDGRLSNRRTWAALAGGAVPDGICLDAEGAIWVASPTTNEFLRVREGGAVAARIAVDRSAIACMLGGPERRTLFLCTSRAHDPAATGDREARVSTVEVDVPGAGWP